MTKNEEKLKELGYEEAEFLIFTNPYFDGALIDVRDGKAVYDYDLMVEALMLEDGISCTESIEFIDYNTIRSLSYYPNSPIVQYNDGEYEDYWEDED